MKKNNFPVFPLGIVALPGSIQSLQIFEPRYMQMVKNCLSENHGFVIVFDSNSKNFNSLNYSIFRIIGGLLDLALSHLRDFKIAGISTNLFSIKYFPG